MGGDEGKVALKPAVLGAEGVWDFNHCLRGDEDSNAEEFLQSLLSAGPHEGEV